ncbi:hypothetical protein GBAR_LOCUS28385 [Geodia barretti]|uniref:Secreted protein n=1 Tax=Geodia barretti TaxID=519541 RepID=A0AA35TP68_GEOBA|nr:hypothetical protein GBAR_LOCUS28385 [Geodia barretti]
MSLLASAHVESIRLILLLFQLLCHRQHRLMSHEGDSGSAEETEEFQDGGDQSLSLNTFTAEQEKHFHIRYAFAFLPRSFHAITICTYYNNGAAFVTVPKLGMCV